MALNSDSMRLRRRLRGGPMTEINVAPFVDVMLVLVVIFMIAAPLLTVGVPVDLPKAAVDPLNEDKEPLIITVDAEGRVYLQESEIEENVLIPRLVAVSEANPDLRVFVRGDRAINYGRVMEVMGMVSEAGFAKVALIAEVPIPKSQDQ
ncbi:MAG: protein TolR [Rhodospirillaceae bacterium]|jgi:biopolymer transport protein TolR|nr:protein TolR [Rhodospirillaceae bacterium]MBT5943595.1 protein TolR [Rhodospirillaceae bacterium]MBT6405932.1 protein TolR [Rhodospirillaceae bacterium]MBT6535870.1 protein TolR [Rhodospirillaceae bacterium]MBT7362742.1 protein TolR [Rhodospirillaceae bacterium]